MFKILQTNLGRGKLSHDLAYAMACERGADLLFVAEPNKNIAKKQGWACDKRQDVAVYIKNPNCGILKIEDKKGWIILEFHKFIILGCYLSPNKPFEDFKKTADEMINKIKQKKKEAIVLGDLNAKSPQWGAPQTDRRGDYWTECMAQQDMIVCNDGSPIFIRNTSETHIDVTCATNKITKKIKNWKTLEDEVASYHKVIYFEVENKNTKSVTYQKNLLDKKKIISTIKEKADECKSVEELAKLAKETTKKTTTSLIRERSLPYWWNGEIENLRKQIIFPQEANSQKQKKERKKYRRERKRTKNNEERVEKEYK